MAKVTITITDLNLTDGDYKVDFSAEGAQIDQGIATAAYFAGYYLLQLCDEQEFVEGVNEFSQRLKSNMVENTDSECLMAEEPVIARLTLSDKDLSTGRYVPFLEFSGGDPDGNHLPTAAQCVGLYMRSLLHDQKFVKDCWKFAEDLVADADTGEILNAEHAPTNDDGPARIAS